MSGRVLGAAALALGVAVAAPAWGEGHAEPIGDAEAGAEVFDYCVGCHEVGAGAENGIGPHLNGIFGRTAGSIENYKYSKGLTREGKLGMVWDLEHLDAYLTNPKALVSDTRMSFDGLDDKTERDDVLAYLRQFSDNPQNIPEAAPTARPPEVELPPEILAMVGDPDYGEYLSNECTTCHQADGDYDGIPGIVSWPEEDFVIAMHAYKRKIRPHPVMQMMAGRLTDEEIAALAAYFGKLE
ncbi:c-type cytochrome [Marimonas arenosa]|uniref:C-type cytochrome n=1 Tax=Marimonas arenosa TaxID=1795305 RepID=A0AAE4B4U7_9RHOB|nr:c-type cytochrome [Marimonas arenosa]MDQ2091413.1 c-type cytochrome [Marimonas arenosa]